jgi:hypothetical protein
MTETPTGNGSPERIDEPTTEQIGRIVDGAIGLHSFLQRHFRINGEEAMRTLQASSDSTLGLFEYIFSRRNFEGRVLREVVGQKEEQSPTPDQSTESSSL